MVSTISETYFNKMEDKLKLLDNGEFELNITGAKGKEISYLGYIEAESKVPNSNMSGLLGPFLILKATEYNDTFPVIVGNNIIRESKRLYIENSDERVPNEWKSAFGIINQTYICKVKSTKDFLLYPMQTKTIIGFLRTNVIADAAITDDLDVSGPDKPINQWYVRE
jgi:hypothetical protein